MISPLSISLPLLASPLPSKTRKSSWCRYAKPPLAGKMLSPRNSDGVTQAKYWKPERALQVRQHNIQHTATSSSCVPKWSMSGRTEMGRQRLKANSGSMLERGNADDSPRAIEDRPARLASGGSSKQHALTPITARSLKRENVSGLARPSHGFSERSMRTVESEIVVDKSPSGQEQHEWVETI